MSRNFIVASLVAVILAFTGSTVPVGARDYAGGAYIGLAPMLGIERFKTEWTEVDTEEGPYKIDPDNSWGVNLKGGYPFTENVAVEAEAAYNAGLKDISAARIVTLSLGVLYMF